MKNTCELCGDVANLYCTADNAHLCWRCDGDVHGANFLCARHLRFMLCFVCHRQTKSGTSGEHLTATYTVCRNCVDRVQTGRDLNFDVLQGIADSPLLQITAASPCESTQSCTGAVCGDSCRIPRRLTRRGVVMRLRRGAYRFNLTGIKRGRESFAQCVSSKKAIRRSSSLESGITFDDEVCKSTSDESEDTSMAEQVDCTPHKFLIEVS